MEEEIRGKMRDLLAQAGSEEHEEIREKVKRLSLLINREKELESEIAALAASASAERLAALVAERMKLEKEEGEQEEAVELRRKEAEEERAARERAEAAAKEAEKAEFRVDYLPEAEEDVAGEDPFVHSFSRLAILVHCLTGGKYNGVLPEFREDGIDSSCPGRSHGLLGLPAGPAAGDRKPDPLGLPCFLGPPPHSGPEFPPAF